ncbi:hypothetical protein ABTX85_37445 [Streptomyces sp. NPDC096097]|uniref:hypothetical protein n=1 Tax=Streptomyces sp. NPDC096097 TaxID=3155546 RepID=UPI003318BE45
MKKIITAAALVLAAVGAATPAHAAEGDVGDLAAGVFDFASSAVCLAEVAVVPVLDGGYAGGHVNNCSAGNVIPSGK